MIAVYQPHVYERTRQLSYELGQALALADKYRFEDAPISGVTVGASYDRAQWLFMTEWAKFNGHSVLADSSAWYMTGGRRIRDFTPYVTVARLKADRRSEAGISTAGMPPALAATATRLNAGVNTAILVSSSFTVHWALEGARKGNRRAMQMGLMLTWLLGATFLFIQMNEYIHVGFSARDGAFGSIFYGLTGLHGAHVFVGLFLLTVANIRAFRGHFGPAAKDHLGVEVSGIYWHFVDVMWIIVFTTVYVL